MDIRITLRAATVAMLGQQAESIGFSLFIRGWHIYQVPPILVTCEEPVVAHSRATTSEENARVSLTPAW